MRPLLLAIVLAGACHGSDAPTPGSASGSGSGLAAWPAPGTLAQPGQLHGFDRDVMYDVIAPPGMAPEDLAARAEAIVEPSMQRQLATPADLGLTATGLGSIEQHLPPGAVDQLLASRAAITLGVRGVGADKVHTVAVAAQKLAADVHGWVHDVNRVALYTPDVFAQHLPVADDVRSMIVVAGVMGDNAQPFLDTFGTHALGLPDLYVPAAGAQQLQMLGVLVDATAQTLMLHPDITKPGELDVDIAALGDRWPGREMRARGGTAKIAWRVRWAASKFGTDLPPFLQLEPMSGTRVQDVEALIDEVTGKPADAPVHIADDDPELVAAGSAARAELTTMLPSLAHGVTPGDRLVVKAPFATAHRATEWMWVDVVSIDATTVTGTLDNDPSDVPSLRAGADVHVPFAKLADFKLTHADGSVRGAYSIAVYKRRGLAH